MRAPSPIPKTAKTDLSMGLILFFLVCLFYWKVLFGHGTFVFVDASRFFFPLWKWGAKALAQGIIPLWNPDAQFGSPYFADPQMAYAYPPVPFLYSFLDPVRAFNAIILLHHFWALLGSWFFLRRQELSVRASLVGCLIFGFSLHLVCSSWTPPAMMTISWMPWIFLFAERLFSGEKGGVLALSLALAMQFSAGYPVLCYLTGLALILHLIWKIFWPSLAGWAGRAKGLTWFPAALGIALVYNLVWGLPFVEFFQQSNYQEGGNHVQALTWLDLGTFLSPFLQGHPLGQDYHGPHYWISTYFIGLPPLCLLVWGLISGGFKKASLTIFALVLVLSLGETLGLGGWLKSLLPGYHLVIRSGFWLAPLLFWAAWLCAESVERLLGDSPKTLNPWSWIGGVGLVYGLSALIGQILFPICFCLSAVSTLLAGVSRKIPSQVRWLLILFGLVSSLGIAAVSVNILLDRSYYEKGPQVIDRIYKPGRLIFSPILMKESVHLQGKDMADAYDWAKQSLLPNWPLMYGKQEVPFYNTFQMKGSDDWTVRAFQISLRHSRRVMDFLGVRYLFGKNQFKDFMPVVDGEGKVPVSENPTTLPIWYSVRRAVAASPTLEEDFLRADKTKMDYGKACFIQDASKAGSYEFRQVLIHEQTPNHVEIYAPGKGKTLIVSSTSAYPGWKVFHADGGWQSPEMINHSFQGLILDEGERVGLVYYQPLSFRLGLFMALLVVGLWMGLLMKTIIGVFKQ